MIQNPTVAERVPRAYDKEPHSSSTGGTGREVARPCGYIDSAGMWPGGRGRGEALEHTCDNRYRRPHIDRRRYTGAQGREEHSVMWPSRECEGCEAGGVCTVAEHARFS